MAWLVLMTIVMFNTIADDRADLSQESENARVRVSKQKAAENREQIVAAAARLFRENGIAATGVDTITRRAGLTHGGLYSQFGSKDALAAAAILLASRHSARRLEPPAERQPAEQGLRRVVRQYLSTSHRDERGRGCVLAALGTEIPRQPRAVRQAFTIAVRGAFDLMAGWIPDGAASGRQRKAIAALSAMVGALVLARAVSDEALSQRILAVSAKSIIDAAWPVRRARDTRATGRRAARKGAS
jgi:TetR/AcrR family transcriptional regulator, transcriptional repressor for nem operon